MAKILKPRILLLGFMKLRMIVKIEDGIRKDSKTQDFTPGFPETDGEIQKFRRELKFPLNPR
jgi:hypothetical protein